MYYVSVFHSFFQTHPNVDKKLFSQNAVIGLKQAGKGFPLNNEIGVLKWRLQTKDENMMPLASEYLSSFILDIFRKISRKVSSVNPGQVAGL